MGRPGGLWGGDRPGAARRASLCIQEAWQLARGTPGSLVRRGRVGGACWVTFPGAGGAALKVSVWNEEACTCVL